MIKTSLASVDFRSAPSKDLSIARPTYHVKKDEPNTLFHSNNPYPI